MKKVALMFAARHNPDSEITKALVRGGADESELTGLWLSDKKEVFDPFPPF